MNNTKPDIILLNILKQMIRIRLVEQYIARRYPEQKMRCPTHLCLGQEAVPAVFGEFADKKDIFVGTYRSHGHYLAKGGNLLSLFAELLGAGKGCSNGYGGSMHIMDEAHNFYGTSAIVGSGIPIATGAAFAFKYRKEPQVVVCFFGDGAVEEGAIYESVNFALLHNLPIIFVCENNGLAVTTPIEQRNNQSQLYDRFKSMGLPGTRLEDNDIEKLAGVAQAAFSKARSGEGPVFIEIAVERWATHVGHDYEGPADYWYTDPHAKEGISCPLVRLARHLIENGKITIEELRKLREKELGGIEADFEKASSFPLASGDNFEEMVYASGMLSSIPEASVQKLGENTYKHKEQSKLINPF